MSETIRYDDDLSALKHRVCNALSSNPYLSRPDQFQVTSDRGRVTLNGEVKSFFQKQMAQESLRGIDGIEQIENQLVVVLGHLGNGEAERILAELPDVAVVVQGHPHRAWDAPLVVDGRLAVNASGYGLDVGRLDLRYDVASRQIVEFDWSVHPVVAGD